ncbi:MAG: hypothetical protein O9289_05875 [Rhodobacteraceae bacterium]|nr:hypothetical protein [Paracoccaceae bacterium]MCZ8082715.1 hypothetical protein [Paracoccaceae bacterium]
MTDITFELWGRARPLFQEHFRFWPDHEDLIWAKTIWPVFLDAGLFANKTDEETAWTGRNVQALALLYAHSAMTFGTPVEEIPEHFSRQWMAFSFGSAANADERLNEVGRSICFAFPGNETFVGNRDFFSPLIRSLVCGAGFHRYGPVLDAYLAHCAEHQFETQVEFNEPSLRRLWIGGHFSLSDLTCLL